MLYCVCINQDSVQYLKILGYTTSWFMCFLKLNLLVAYLPKSEQCRGFFYGSPCKVFNVGEYLLRSPPDDFRMWKRWETVGNRLVPGGNEATVSFLDLFLFCVFFLRILPW